MSHTFIPTTTADEPDDVTNEQWVDELHEWLRTHEFPTRRDTLVASLLLRHAPARLLWRLSCLDADRSLESIDDVVSCVDEQLGGRPALRYQPREPACPSESS